MRDRLPWLMLLFGLLPGALPAALPETPQLRRIGVAEGLPASQVSVLAQDRDGYLWLATSDGLARYDGIDFEVFQHRPGDRQSLPGNTIQALHIDAQNRVWVSAESGGLSRLQADRRQWRHWSRKNTPALRSDDIWAIASTADGALWFGGYASGLYRLDGERWQRFDADPDDPTQLPSDTVLALALGPDGALWVGTDRGAARYTGAGFERIADPALDQATIYSLLPEPDGSVWLGSSAGLFRRRADGRIQDVPWGRRPAIGGVLSLLRDRRGGYWLGTQQGLWRLRAAPGEAGIDRLEPMQVHAVLTQSLVEDHEGGIWFGSQGGLFQLVPGWRQFAVFERGPVDFGRGSGRVVRGSSVDAQGGIWLAATTAGLLRLDPDSGRIRRYDLKVGPGQPPRTTAMSVLAHSDGSIWVGDRTGLSRFEPASGALRRWTVQDPTDPVPPVGLIDLLLEDDQGRIWLLSQGDGLQVRDRDGGVLWDVRPGDAQGLADARVEQLDHGPDGAIWIAGAAGVRRWNAPAMRFEPVPGAPSGMVYSFAFNGDGPLWLARLGTLESYRWEGGRLRLLDRVDGGDGLPAAEPGGLLVDPGGEVWMTTPRGLWRYSPARRFLRRYGERDGLPSQEFDARPPRLTPAGIGVAGTAAGLVLIDSLASMAAPAPSPLVWRRASVRHGDAELPLDPQRPLRIRSDDRDLRVDAGLLSFADPQAHRYRFRLPGYDPGWVEQGARSERLFSRLDPGRYRLEAQAANAEGVWSAPRTLKLTVTPMWWQTGWARAGYALLAALALGAAAGAYRLRLRRRYALQLAEQGQRMAERASEAKSRFLANLGHELRTPMTGVLGMTELLLSSALPPPQRGRVEAIARAGRHLLRLVNDALDLARIEAGKLSLNLEPFDPGALLYEVDALLGPLARGKALNLRCALPAELPRRVKGDVYRIRQILLNLGGNAIKFTERGEVVLGAEAAGPDRLRFTVTDSGAGLAADEIERVFGRFEQGRSGRTGALGSGLGLAICRELVEAMSGRIGVDSQPGRGSVFWVELPLPVAAALAATEQDPPVVAPRGSTAWRLLLVEDDPTVAEVIRGLLEARGHQVVWAAHSLEALARLESDRFDLALVDLDLPGLSGIELAELLRAQGRRLPLLAITARADAQAQVEAGAAGMDGFLRKPLTGDMLSEAIETTITACR